MNYNSLKIVADEVMRKCPYGYSCIITLIKYQEPNDPSKNRKIGNKYGIKIEDVKVSWNDIFEEDPNDNQRTALGALSLIPCQLQCAEFHPQKLDHPESKNLPLSL